MLTGVLRIDFKQVTYLLYLLSYLLTQESLAIKKITLLDLIFCVIKRC